MSWQKSDRIARRQERLTPKALCSAAEGRRPLSATQGNGNMRCINAEGVVQTAPCVPTNGGIHGVATAQVCGTPSPARTDTQFLESSDMFLPTRASLMLLAATVILLGVYAASLAAEHTKDSLESVKERLKDKSAILLDVREQKEWDEGHLKDARLVPLSKLKVEAEAEKLTKDLPKEKIVYCHCRAGVRALTAADILKKQGFDVRPLKDGYKNLLNAGFPKAEK
jgi:rhodanese-related sulfurtransferase